MSVAPDAIGLPTTGADVATADSVEAPVPHCRITGAIDPVDPSAPDVNFQVNLPLEWNRKGLHYGGGYNGELVTGTEPARFNPDDAPTPVARGFATWGSDSGHQSSSRLDGRFLMNEERAGGSPHAKKRRNGGVLAVKKFDSLAVDWLI